MTRRKADQAPKEVRPRKRASTIDKLTDLMELFCQEYLVDLNATQAAIRAGYSKNGAGAQGSRLLSYPVIQKRIEELKAQRVQRVQVDQDRIVQELVHISFADANGLVQYRRTCCRHCYGIEHRYQFTKGEMEKAKVEHQALILKARTEGIKLSADETRFDEQGGIGFDGRKEPHPECPECFGEGRGRIYAMDTRFLPDDVRALYAGVKQGKDGLEIKMHSKEGHMQLLMRHVGMLNDKLKLQGDPENPLLTLLKRVQGTALRPSGPEPEDDE